MKLAQTKKKKRKVGRPLEFKTVKELQDRINKYFKWVEDNQKPLTIERLCVFLGEHKNKPLNRKYLTDLEESHKEFSPTIKKAKLIIEASKVERLQTQSNVAGLIFDLVNNHQWRNEQYLKGEGFENKNIVINFHADGKPEPDSNRHLLSATQTETLPRG